VNLPTPWPEVSPNAAPARSVDAATATLEPDADAVDLYALGAIDYAESI